MQEQGPLRGRLGVREGLTTLGTSSVVSLGEKPLLTIYSLSCVELTEGHFER